MKKYLDKFWLAPALAIIVLAVLYAAGFGICTHATDLTAENGVVENATYFCYAVMFVFVARHLFLDFLTIIFRPADCRF